MTRARPSRPVSRRSAIGRMAAGSAAVLGGGRLAFGQQRPKAGGAIRVEKQPTGAEIWQVTTEQFNHSNIYCEVAYCSRDSRYFVYERRDPKLSGNRTELMVVELGTWKQDRLDVAAGMSGCAISHDGVFYYTKRTDRGELDLLRVDISEGKPRPIYRLTEDPRPSSYGTVSPDGRYYAFGGRLDPQWKSFGIVLVDLREGRQTIIDRDPYILNPHPQFEPGAGRQLMIQHNRCGEFSPDGKLLHLVGPQGATLYLLSVPDGKRTELQVGKPFTTACTGHEAWIGDSQEMLLSVSARGEYAPQKGNLLGVRAGQPARVVAAGYQTNHVGVSRCGKYFCCDDWRGTYPLVIGSSRTGKTAVVCHTHTKPARSQNTHTHGYLTPDLKWVIFNSNRSGFPHVYAASVPTGMIEGLSEA